MPKVSIFESAKSFAVIIDGYINVCVLGFPQVTSNVDLANLTIPRKALEGMGGMMDLVDSPDYTETVVGIDHVAK